MTTSTLAPAPRYWLMKSEPDQCSIDDALAAPNATVPWTGVRNYQARNFMRDGMQVGDGVLSTTPAAQARHCRHCPRGQRHPPRPTQFDPASPYFDPKSPADAPRWLLLDVQALRKTRLISLAELRSHPGAGGHAGAAKRQPPVHHAGGGVCSGPASPMC